MKRLALIATPRLVPDRPPLPGALDGDLVRSRLPLDDTRFRVVDLDPAVDLAEQIDVLLEREAPGADDSVVLYASGAAALSDAGEFFLCLDPANPDTGDAIADVAAVFRDRAAGAVLFVLECRHAADEADPFRSATVVAAAKDSLKGVAPGIALLIGARPAAEGAEELPSPFTRVLVETIDDVDPVEGITCEALYARMRDGEALLGVVPGFGFVKGTRALDIVPAQPKARAVAPEPTPPPASVEPVVAPPVSPEPAARPASGAAPVEEAQAASPPVEVAALAVASGVPGAASAPDLAPPGRGSMASIEVVVDVPDARASSEDLLVEVDEEAAPPPRHAPPPPPKRKPPVDERSLPKVVVDVSKSVPPPPADPAPTAPPVPAPASERPASSVRPASTEPAAPAPKADPAPAASRPGTSNEATIAELIAAAEAAIAAQALDDASAELKKALARGTATPGERATIYVRMGDVKRAQGKAREAVSNYEKALSIVPGHRVALDATLELAVAEKDVKGIAAAEDRLLALEKDLGLRFELLTAYAKRWEDAGDAARARARYEAARDLRPEDVRVLDELARIYESSGARDLALAMRRRAAQAAPEGKPRGARYLALGKHLVKALERDEEGLATLELALEADPGALEALELIAQVLAERQEWSELERAYRRMLGRVGRLPKGAVRAEITWELCRRLGLLLRDHLDDPELALDAFADSLAEKPEDLGGHLVAADLARETGQLDRAVGHLQEAAALDPSRLQTFHALFELYQRTKRPDQAYCAAAVTSHLRAAEPRERFVFEEHRPTGLPKLERPLDESAWDLFKPIDRDRNVAAIFAAVTPQAIAFRAARDVAEGRVPPLDPATRQDPHLSTLSIVRSFVWASHLLGVTAPPLYVREEAPIALAAVASEPPAVVAGGNVLRGRGLAELAFLAGRQLAYFVGEHRLLLYYPSLDDLSACFLAAIGVAKSTAPVPGKLRAEVEAIQEHFEAHLADHELDRLLQAVTDLEQAGGRVDLSRWAGSVERCATRAGYTLADDLDVVAGVLRAEPRSVLGAEAKLDDLFGFVVSDAYHDIRALLGVAIEP
jgi:tetratricopeptide (TPR) repeat protein